MRAKKRYQLLDSKGKPLADQGTLNNFRLSWDRATKRYQAVDSATNELRGSFSNWRGATFFARSASNGAPTKAPMARGYNANSHPFLKERLIKQGFLLVRLNFFSTHTNKHGGFFNSHQTAGGGVLWPTRELAEAAAIHVLKKLPGERLGIFHLEAIAEETNVVNPVHFTEI